MLDLLLLVLPVFALVALGWAAATLKLVSDKAVDGLSQIVFLFGAPALLFKLVAEARFPAVLPWGYWLAYFGGMALCWTLAVFFARRFFDATPGAAVIAGLSTGQANTVMIGIPVILKAYGEAAALPIALLIAVNLPITMTVATLMLEGARARGGGLEVWRRLAVALATHPILVGVLAGVAVNLLGARPPATVQAVIDLLAGLALPGGLIALGLSLARHGVRDHLGLGLTVTALRLLVHPAIAFVVAGVILQLPPVWTGTAVLFAAMPAGINAYLFANRYGEGEGLSSTAIALSTFLALFSTVLWLRVLGVG